MVDTNAKFEWWLATPSYDNFSFHRYLCGLGRFNALAHWFSSGVSHISSIEDAYLGVFVIVLKFFRYFPIPPDPKAIPLQH